MLLWIVYGVGVIAACLVPAEAIPFDQLPNDKVMHFGSYIPFGLAPLICFRPLRLALWATLAGPIIGVLVELAQSLSPGRTPEFGDAAANTFGVFVGLLIGVAIRAVKKL